MPTTETSLRAAPSTEAVELTRRLAARTMRSWNLLKAEEAVTAIVAELVANVVQHARTPLELRLALLDGRVRVEVRDRDDRMPVPRTADILAEGGRGMFLVEVYSTRWGAEGAPGGGKVVWAEVDIDTEAEPGPQGVSRGTSPRP
ncbi:hypothetical protein GCM10022221_75430 [Actinocorallia aurea]